MVRIHQEGHGDAKYGDHCPSSLSWSQEDHGDWTSRTLSRWHLSSILELESRVIDGSGDAKFQITWRLDIRNPIKMTRSTTCPPSLSWSQKWLWVWGSIRKAMEMLSFRSHEDWTSGTLSRWHLSSIFVWWEHGRDNRGKIATMEQLDKIDCCTAQRIILLPAR